MPTTRGATTKLAGEAGQCYWARVGNGWSLLWGLRACTDMMGDELKVVGGWSHVWAAMCRYDVGSHGDAKRV